MEDSIAISVNDVSKNFRLPHQKVTSIKSGIVNVFRNRNKKIEVQHALNSVSFDIKKGEFFGIVGRNGSGKSTLLKIISGIYRPDEGGVRVNGSLVPFIELGVGFNPELSGRENVYLNGALLGFSKKQIDAMYSDIVEFAELEKFMDQKLKNYSSGMQVRLAFSVAIRAESDILVLDEVLAVGDAAFQQKCFDYFEEMRRSDKTVILVTHDMGAVQRFCDRALLIKNGKIIKVGKPLDVAEDYIAENVEATNNSQKQKNRINEDLSLKIKEQTDNEVNIQFKFSELNKIGAYIGFSIIRDGASIAELNSSKVDLDTANGILNYKLRTDLLNPGSYELTVAGFDKDRRLISTSDERVRFIVKGYDITRGAALKLDDALWSVPIKREHKQPGSDQVIQPDN